MIIKAHQHTPRLMQLPTWQLSQAAARSHRILHERLANAGVSGYEYRVLAVLGDQGIASQADLGRAAALDRRDVTHAVRALEQRQLITRRPDPSDARQVLVTLTATGDSVLDQLDAVMNEVQEEVLTALTRAQRHALLDLLGQLS